jgi:hypothetical protein
MVVRKKQKSPQELGKAFEADVQAVLVKMQTSFPVAFSRFYDTMSAGAYLPAQPCDFEVGYRGVTTKLELKCSTVHKTMNRTFITSNISESQGALFRLWHRAGVGVFYLFKDEQGGEVELWDGRYIVEVKNTPKMPPDTKFRVCRVPATPAKIEEALMSLLVNEAKRIIK